MVPAASRAARWHGCCAVMCGWPFKLNDQCVMLRYSISSAFSPCVLYQRAMCQWSLCACVRATTAPGSRDPRSNMYHLFIYLFLDTASLLTLPWQHTHIFYMLLFLVGQPLAVLFYSVHFQGYFPKSWIMNNVHCVGEWGGSYSSVTRGLSCFHNKMTLKSILSVSPSVLCGTRVRFYLWGWWIL